MCILLVLSRVIRVSLVWVNLNAINDERRKRCTGLVIWRFPNPDTNEWEANQPFFPPGKTFFRRTWTSILPRENWIFGTSPNIWGDLVFKWTHRLQKEADNLKRSLHCASWGCYPRLSGGGGSLIKKVPMIERLPRRFNIVEHRKRQLLHAESPAPARGVFDHPVRAENSLKSLVC